MKLAADLQLLINPRAEVRHICVGSAGQAPLSLYVHEGCVHVAREAGFAAPRRKKFSARLSFPHRSLVSENLLSFPKY